MPTCLFAGSAMLYFAVRFRNGVAAGMVSAGPLVIILMFSELITRGAISFTSISRAAPPRSCHVEFVDVAKSHRRFGFGRADAFCRAARNGGEGEIVEVR